MSSAGDQGSGFRATRPKEGRDADCSETPMPKTADRLSNALGRVKMSDELLMDGTESMGL